MAALPSEQDILSRDLEWYKDLQRRLDLLSSRITRLPPISASDLEPRVALASTNPSVLDIELATVSAYQSLIRSLNECKRLIDLDFSLTSAVLMATRMRMGDDAYKHVMESVGGPREVLRRGLGQRGKELDEMIWDLEQLRVRNDETQQLWIATDFVTRLKSLKTCRDKLGNQEEGVAQGK